MIDLLLDRGGAADADLDAIIQECLRLAPVAGMLSRRSTGRPATIGQTPIEPNSLVCVLTGAAANDPRVLPDGRASGRIDRRGLSQFRRRGARQAPKRCRTGTDGI